MCFFNFWGINEGNDLRKLKKLQNQTRKKVFFLWNCITFARIEQNVLHFLNRFRASCIRTCVMYITEEQYQIKEIIWIFIKPFQCKHSFDEWMVFAFLTMAYYDLMKHISHRNWMENCVILMWCSKEIRLIKDDDNTSTLIHLKLRKNCLSWIVNYLFLLFVLNSITFLVQFLKLKLFFRCLLRITTNLLICSFYIYNFKKFIWCANILLQKTSVVKFIKGYFIMTLYDKRYFENI